MQLPITDKSECVIGAFKSRQKAVEAVCEQYDGMVTPDTLDENSSVYAIIEAKVK